MVDESISHRELFERLVKLETLVDCQTQAESKALTIAREIVQGDVRLAKTEIDAKLEVHNQWQRRFDRLEGELATKSMLTSATDHLKELFDERIRPIFRLVYIGFGIGSAIGVYIHFTK